MDRFAFRKLLVYQKALEVVLAVNNLATRIPREHIDLRWQLRRAARSIVLNVAEGAGEFSPKEKARFYRIARRSGFETIGALDLAIQDGFFKAADTPGVMRPLDEVTAMLTTMVKRAEARAPRPRPRRRPTKDS